MTVFVFENMTQADADGATGNDVIAVSAVGANAFNVGVAISATSPAPNAVTLTIGLKSLSFNAAVLKAISAKDNIVFNDGTTINIGTNDSSSPDVTADFTVRGEIVYLFGGDDVYAAADSNVFVYGGDGADRITGGAGADHLYGFGARAGVDAADTIKGGAAGDYIQGNAGDDHLDGEAGSDRIQGGAGNDTIIDTGGGNDSINGNTGDDTIDGGTGNDRLRGGQGNDSLHGGDNDDILMGDLGADTLNGGLGVDMLTGGSGADLFRFTDAQQTITASGVTYTETIADFVDGDDRIRIEAAGGNLGDGPGELVFGAPGASFSDVAAARAYAQQLLDDNPTNTLFDVAVVRVGADLFLFYDSDATGGTIDSVIRLAGVSDPSLLTSADFG